MIEEILEKHWQQFRLSIGLPYEPMSEKAKESMLNAMREYSDISKNQHRKEGYLAGYTRQEDFYKLGAECFKNLKEEDFEILYGV